MKKLMQKLEDLMVAITFAEAGEYDTCKQILNEKDSAGETNVETASSEPETALAE